MHCSTSVWDVLTGPWPTLYCTLLCTAWCTVHIAVYTSNQNVRLQINLGKKERKKLLKLWETEQICTPLLLLFLLVFATAAVC